MLLIKNGQVIDPASGTDQVMDIIAENGVISDMGCGLAARLEGNGLPEGVQVIDANGLVVAPGLIDVDVHFRDPGLTYKEDIHTGAAAAARDRAWKREGSLGGRGRRRRGRGSAR